MSAAHTPGPWSVFQPDPDSVPGIEAANRSTVVMYGIRREDDCGVYGGDRIQEIANASLIAAAPDLLEALTGLLARYTELVNCGDCGNWNPEKEAPVIAARSAVAKATALKASEAA